ncbi:LOW QUALITY PROTEIN: 2,3-bisphosphoglycerate-dependent phosphoglycerate mutase [Aggregatibacter actinomycetemcomitans ANH9381]|nr:LOW QUALITY PROTEIN: 2,3-bisphosphoglycerate-dependent phosphoglycerate mutase [Aggregatibacter actinomycetemcomitans ANH9381]
MNLTERGVEEAKAAGKKLLDAGFEFDIAFTSVLTRAIKTCNIVLEESHQLWIPQVKNWRLNERHYGELQGLDKKPPPKNMVTNKFTSGAVPTTHYHHYLIRKIQIPLTTTVATPIYRMMIPDGENLKVTLARVLPFWDDQIALALLSGKRVLVVAHGNSLRALAKHIEGISDADIMDLEIPTGQPLVYKLDDNLKVVEKFYL